MHDFPSNRQLWVQMSAVVNVLQFYNWKICKFIFESPFFSSCAQSFHTQCWTLSDLITAWKRQRLYEPQSSEGGGQDWGLFTLSAQFVSSQTECIYQQQKSSSWQHLQLLCVSVCVCVCMCVIKTLLCKWSRGPWSLRVIQAVLQQLQSRWGFALDVVSSFLTRIYWCQTAVSTGRQTKLTVNERYWLETQIMSMRVRGNPCGLACLFSPTRQRTN